MEDSVSARKQRPSEIRPQQPCGDRLQLTFLFPAVESLCKLVRGTFAAVVRKRVLALVHDLDQTGFEAGLEDGRELGVFDPVRQSTTNKYNAWFNRTREQRNRVRGTHRCSSRIPPE